MNLFSERAARMRRYAAGTLTRPQATFRELLDDPLSMGYGFAAILLTGGLYTITVIFGYLNGFGAVVQPWIPLPAEDYYLYEAFFGLPVFMLSTLVYAAVVQSLSVFLGGRGTFEECLSVAGFSLWITIIPLMWIPETATMVFLPHLRTGELGGTLGLAPALDMARQLITFFWQIVVTLIGLKQVQRFSWQKTLIIGLIGYAAYWVIFWTYIR